MISKDELLINICYFDIDDSLRFTSEFMALTKDLSNRRAFACQLVSWWGIDHVSTLLDWFGPLNETEDQFNGVDGDAMGVNPDICDLLEYKDVAVPWLSSDWYRDLLVYKFISIKLPERLIKEYVAAINKNKGV